VSHTPPATVSGLSHSLWSTRWGQRNFEHSPFPCGTNWGRRNSCVFSSLRGGSWYQNNSWTFSI